MVAGSVANYALVNVYSLSYHITITPFYYQQKQLQVHSLRLLRGVKLDNGVSIQRVCLGRDKNVAITTKNNINVA